MITTDEMKVEVTKIVGRVMPSVEIARVNSKAITDSNGDASIAITIVVRQRPPRKEAEKLVEVVDQFRTWLVNRNDERFPYFRLLSEDEERELQKADS
ncbi:MAG: hypothetical protein ABSA49_00660 [Rhizomicrobium sp.]|jgi:hypothetical protein